MKEMETLDLLKGTNARAKLPTHSYVYMLNEIFIMNDKHTQTEHGLYRNL